MLRVRSDGGRPAGAPPMPAEFPSAERTRLAAGVFVLAVVVGCRASAPAEDKQAIEAAKTKSEQSTPEWVASREDWSHDIRATALTVDVASRAATAIIELAPSSSRAASFEIGDLQISAVRGPQGPLRFTDVGARLDVVLPPGEGPITLEVDYSFAWHADRKGAIPFSSTLVWPYNCGNLFPCKSDPADGLRLSLKLTGVDSDEIAIYPTSLASEAPSYQLAWAIGDYERRELGETRNGTLVSVWYLLGSEAAVAEGTASLRAAFDWLEQTYGGYAYGSEVGSVEVPSLGYAGMEHHPYWHVDTSALAEPGVHIHEAAHGWFGAGVRIACWEDLVLSEGTTTYLTVRAIEAVEGIAAAQAVWADHRRQLIRGSEHSPEKIAWPVGCGRVDVLEFFGGLVYMKGAFFYRALERRVGRAALDSALAAAYAHHRGQAATMQDILDILEARTGYDPKACAAAWLRADGLPPDIDAPCP